jgi:hypothetical protein
MVSSPKEQMLIAFSTTQLQEAKYKLAELSKGMGGNTTLILMARKGTASRGKR